MSEKQLTFDEKVIALKKMHKGSAPEALKQISGWEERMGQLEMEKAWLEHPNTQELRKVAIEQMTAIDKKLSSERDLPDAVREALFEVKDAHMYYLAVLTTNPESEILSIEASVDSEL